MKCPYCQNEYDAAAEYCPVCFTKTNSDCSQAKGYAPTAVELIKKIGGGKLFLVACILYSISCAIDFFVNGEFSALNILMAVGLWMFYYECTKKDQSPFVLNSSPFTLMTVAQTIMYVFSWIGAVALAVSLCLLIVLGGSIKEVLGPLSFLSDVLAVICVLGILILAAEIILRKSIKNYIKSIAESAKTGLRPRGLSNFTPIFLIIHSAISMAAVLATNILSFVFIDKIASGLAKMSEMLIPQNNPYVYYDPAVIESEPAPLFMSLLVLVGGVVSSLLPIVARLFFARVMLDANKLAETSYYPTEEELFYQKQAYYYQKQTQAQTQGSTFYQPTYQQGEGGSQFPGEAPCIEEQSCSTNDEGDGVAKEEDTEKK